MDEEGDGKPPPALDTVTRGVSPVGLVFGEVRQCLDRVCPIALVRGAGIRRRDINLPYIRAEG